MTSHDLSSVAVEILVTLSQGPRHGYAIKLDVEQRIGGDFILGSGSLYQALQRLERRGLIGEAEAGGDGDARRGRAYRLLPAGERTLAVEIERMQRVIAQAGGLAAEGSAR